ncbi:hypothetical protein MESS2_1320021 [Mesorhizobium metallidurans STM 2683]|uniref:Uncharacterized protein n=1 Tax=Mesorhizobium metallidurans STM 2683 TaxID=1297569 RepID=M5EIQ3_9HYPH|nr:hypothetical protein MESS2_1320021 [Mesorhizobium metallidurans STM 2683]
MCSACCGTRCATASSIEGHPLRIRFARKSPIADVGAAPHLPAGILSPYSDGERVLTLPVSPITNVARMVPALRPAAFSR